MATPNASVAGCPRITDFFNAASRTKFNQSLVADCVIAIKGENFSATSQTFDPPVMEAGSFFLLFPPEARFPIYSIAPNEIVCVVPSTLSSSQPYQLELHVPQQGPVPCPTVTNKGLIVTASPGLFTLDGTVSGPGMFFQYPDGDATPILPGDSAEPTMLQVYGTGFRHISQTPTAMIDGISVPVVAWEADTTRPGYDRLIFQLPEGFPSGTHRFKIVADGKTSNEVTLEMMSATRLQQSAGS